jgi:hypothetical protein
MTEEVYLALKAYTAHLNEGRKEGGNKPLTPTGVNTRLLLGTTPPIPEQFLEAGKGLARANEKEREDNPEEPKTEEDLQSEFSSGVNFF